MDLRTSHSTNTDRSTCPPFNGLTFTAGNGISGLTISRLYLRLKTLQVAYNFHFPLMKKLGLNTCQLAFAGYNLWTITPYLWGDPEARATNAPSYPLSKTYTLSLKLGF